MVPGWAGSQLSSPRARAGLLVGRQGDAWKVRVAVPPERGRANDAVCGLLAGLLGVGRDEVSIAAGGSGRRKVVDVDGLARDEIDRRLAAAVR